MPNYNETSAREKPGTTYRRVRYLSVRNDPVGLPVFELLEADAAFIEGAKTHIRENVGGIALAVDGDLLAKWFPFKNPADDSALPGGATGQELLVMLYSFCRERQRIRDNHKPPRQAWTYDEAGRLTGSVWVPCDDEGNHALPPSATFTAPPAGAAIGATWDGTAWTVPQPGATP